MRVLYCDALNNLSATPQTLTTVASPQTPVDPDHVGSGFQDDGLTDNLHAAPTAAAQKHFRFTEGAMALMRALKLIRDQSGADWATVATDVRDQYADEFTGEDLTDDLLAGFAD